MGDYLLLLELEEENIQAKRSLNQSRRKLRDTHNPFELPENEFRKVYRLSRMAARDFVDDLIPFIPNRQRVTAIPNHIQILSSVQFLASGSYQRRVGLSFQTCMSQSSFSNSLKNTLNVVANIYDRWIQFPNTFEKTRNIQARFLEKFNFPNVIGIIDGSQIPIVQPVNEVEEAYLNRKGYHSLNTMIVCGPDNEITALNARYGGRTHDSRVYRNSELKEFIDRKYEEGLRHFWIIGDSGYGLTPTLMTPIHNPPRGSAAERFNNRLVTCRSLIERTIGTLKGRWRCLRKERALHYNPIIAGNIINTCCVLHNICKQFRIPDPVIEDDEDNDNDEEDEDDEEFEHGQAVRDNIIRHFFE